MFTCLSQAQTVFKTTVSLSKDFYYKSINYEVVAFMSNVSFHNIDEMQFGYNLGVGESFIFPSSTLLIKANYKFFGTRGYKTMEHFLGGGISFIAGNQDKKVRFRLDLDCLAGIYSPSKLGSIFTEKSEENTNYYYGLFYYSSPVICDLFIGIDVRLLKNLRFIVSISNTLRRVFTKRISWYAKEDVQKKLANATIYRTTNVMMGLKLGLSYSF